MIPLKKVPSLPETGQQLEPGGIVQAGRSGSSLGGEKKSAQSLSRPVSSDALHEKNDMFVAQQTLLIPEPITTSLKRQRSAPSLTKRASYAPAVPSPLNPASEHSSRSSLGSAENLEPILSTTDSGSSGVGPQSHSTNSLTSTRGARRNKLTPAQQFLREKSARTFRPVDIIGPDTPKHVNDLGRDYSRYPINAPTPSRPSSLVRPDPSALQSTPLLRTTTTNPFSDSQANLREWGYPDDSIGAFNPYFGGEQGFILYVDEFEADDKYHTPAADDIVFRPKLREYLEPRQIVSTIGALFLVLGLVCVFVILPILTFQTRLFVPVASKYPIRTGPAWAHVNNNTYNLLKNVRKGLIDPDTPASAKTRKSTFDGSTLNLVFSDEFNENNRTFYPGDDPYWTAPDIWYGATQDMEWYDPDAVTTYGGTLQLRLDQFPNHGLQYRSGMLNSWNQLCFKGGVFEISVSLAGPSGIPGLWPGAWAMGNLGRPGYLSTTDGVWPYTYNTCDAGITPNQSSPDGLSYLPGQKLSSCTCSGSEHPNPGTGRGAPEIDILEASVDPNNRIGVVTQSFQVAPFDIFYRPNPDFMAIPNYNTTQMNTYCGGPYQQAVSGTTLLNNNWYDGLQYQKYAFEYIPGTSSGKIAWFVGDDPTFIMDGRAIGPNGNVGARQVSQEPMAMVLNLGISGSWSQILLADLKFPTIMHIDYVRIYQKAGQTSVTCDPPGYPTTQYIEDHLAAYHNPNFTVCLLCSIPPP
jgi:beta-glucanase (GH16 family)